MEQIHYRYATEQDAQLMTVYRIEFLTELLGRQSEENVLQLKIHLEKYFADAVRNNTYIGVLAIAGDKVAGTGGMTIRTQAGSFKNPSGITGYILNMYTLPAYRKRGICNALLKMLIEKGKETGVGGFELHATKDGEPLYKKAGFKMHNEPTYRKFDFEIP